MRTFFGLISPDSNSCPKIRATKIFCVLDKGYSLLGGIQNSKITQNPWLFVAGVVEHTLVINLLVVFIFGSEKAALQCLKSLKYPQFPKTEDQ